MGYHENIDAYQQMRDKRVEGGDDPAPITQFQAAKCAAMLDAYFGGLELYETAARATQACLELSAVGGNASVVPTAAESWAIIEGTPWPPPRQMWPKPA